MKDTASISARLQKETEEFLAKGGKIKVIPPQSFSESFSKKTLSEETYARYTAKKNKS
jgi:hypothetical protein